MAAVRSRASPVSRSAAASSAAACSRVRVAADTWGFILGLARRVAAAEPAGQHLGIVLEVEARGRQDVLVVGPDLVQVEPVNPLQDRRERAVR